MESERKSEDSFAGVFHGIRESMDEFNDMYTVKCSWSDEVRH
jgi:hypothetical protein